MKKVAEDEPTKRGEEVTRPHSYFANSPPSGTVASNREEACEIPKFPEHPDVIEVLKIIEGGDN